MKYKYNFWDLTVDEIQQIENCVINYLLEQDNYEMSYSSLYYFWCVSTEIPNHIRIVGSGDHTRILDGMLKKGLIESHGSHNQTFYRVSKSLIRDKYLNQII